MDDDLVPGSEQGLRGFPTQSAAGTGDEDACHVLPFAATLSPGGTVRLVAPFGGEWLLTSHGDHPTGLQRRPGQSALVQPAGSRRSVASSAESEVIAVAKLLP